MAKVVAKKVVIRSMKEEDLSDVLAVDRKIFGRDRALTYSDPVQDYVGGEMGMSWVAEVQGKIAGFILCQLAEPRPGMPHVAWIGSIGVDPDFRHKGIAGELTKSLMKQCQSLKLKEIHIMADRHDEILEGFLSFMNFRPAELVHYVRNIEE
ncbi:MAG: GNAT family N-acetyltransferase [Dehalococcoidia bacterium]|nr:GNAT family N-acetyltransferase [Dehalococcoidia bacterium]